MPNGGPLQSCLICRWVKTDPNHEQSWKQATCQRHSMEINRPDQTFCSDLSTTLDWRKPGRFVRQNKIRGQDVYTWIEIIYTTKDYPSLPQYHHEYALLAPIKVYASWSEQQRNEAAQAIYEQKEKEFREKYGSGPS